MIKLLATIKNIAYKKMIRTDLSSVSIHSDVNTWPSRCYVDNGQDTFAVSKWVSPKRTRSYPYSRVYDTLDSSALKTVTIIPIIKDEGQDGDLDYLQWDTVSLMNLLNVYVIVAFYEDANKNNRKDRKPNKITEQKLNSLLIKQKLEEIRHYHSSALHWNVEQLKIDNLQTLVHHVTKSYQTVAKKLNIQMHNPSNYENFMERISNSVDGFMNFSREKSEAAMNRETITIQPKESVGKGEKAAIEIRNYQGGNYFLTVDELVSSKKKQYLMECKHSSSGLLPSIDDIKDGLIKMFLFSNIDSISVAGHPSISFNPVPGIRLTSKKLNGSFHSTESNTNLTRFMENNGFNKKQKEFLQLLLNEAQTNHFEVWLNGSE